MRKRTTYGVVLLLLLGIAVGLWLLLNPPDHAAPVGPAVNQFAMAPNEAPGQLDLPAPEPVGNSTPDPEVDPAVDPPPEPDVDEPAEVPKPAGLKITGRVEDSQTGAPLQYVYVALTSQTDTPWADAYTYTAGDGTFTFALHYQPVPADAYLTADRPGYVPGYQQVADTNIIRLVRETATEVPVEGAELRVVVIGPEGQPLPGVEMWVTSAGKHTIRATTGESGEVLRTGFAAPSTWSVQLRHVGGIKLAVEKQQVEFASPADRKEARFDLTGTGIVDYAFTVNGESLPNITVKYIDEDGKWRIAAECIERDGQFPKLIYGLKPGKYFVIAAGWGSGHYLEFIGPFEVTQPPAASSWRKDYKTSTLTVRVNGGGNDLRLSYTCGGKFPVYEIAPQPGGEFVIEGLAGGNGVRLRAFGDGWASDTVDVYPMIQPEVQIDVVAAGTLKLSARGAPDYSLRIWGVEPVRKPIILQCQQGGSFEVLQLPPGRYRVERWGWGDSPPWDPVECTVNAGQQTECIYGASYTSTLQLRARGGQSLSGYAVTLEKDGQPVKAATQDNREGFKLVFEAEGKLTLRIKGDGIEDFEREFEVSRGGTATLEIELKQKQ